MNHQSRPDYWVFRYNAPKRRGRAVVAQLLRPSPEEISERYAGSGFKHPVQVEPYGFADDFVFAIKGDAPVADVYIVGYGFVLYSARLLNLTKQFGVQAESFPALLLHGKASRFEETNYSIFHLTEPLLDAMDVVASQWLNSAQGIPRLVLKKDGFDRRPMFRCDRIYTQVMRDDLRQEIKRQEITGFEFLDPQLYRTGQYGFPPPFEP